MKNEKRMKNIVRKNDLKKYFKTMKNEKKFAKP